MPIQGFTLPQTLHDFIQTCLPCRDHDATAVAVGLDFQPFQPICRHSARHFDNRTPYNLFNKTK